jgi:hypothetical protein
MADEKPKKNKKWVQAATEGAHGQFAAKAKEAGETTREFAEGRENSQGKLGKQARLAETLMGFSKKPRRSAILYNKKD